MGQFDLLHYIWPDGSQNIFPNLHKHSNVVSAVPFRLQHGKVHPSLSTAINIFFPDRYQSIHVSIHFIGTVIALLLNEWKNTKWWRMYKFKFVILLCCVYWLNILMRRLMKFVNGNFTVVILESYGWTFENSSSSRTFK